MSAISVTDLRKSYGDVPALDGLSFDVATGSIFGLLGPNGAGKSTTLKILTTIARPTSGVATVLGCDVVTRALDVRRRIAVVTQDHATEIFLTVRDNLLTFARFHGVTGAEARSRAERVIDQFDLRAEAHRKTMDLSGGFKRRVQVGKMLMVDTPILFLDEFSTGMDPILKRSVMNLLRAERDRGRTIVLTTQILSEAEELCDDILIVNKGRQVARGDLPTLKLLSQGVYEVSITFESLPQIVRDLIAARQPLRLELSGNTAEFALREPEAEVLAFVAELLRHARALRIELGGASLEDIFVELMKGGRA